MAAPHNKCVYFVLGKILSQLWQIISALCIVQNDQMLSYCCCHLVTLVRYLKISFIHLSVAVVLAASVAVAAD